MSNNDNNHNEDDRHIQEDTPMLRSVALAPSQYQQPMLSFAESRSLLAAPKQLATTTTVTSKQVNTSSSASLDIAAEPIPDYYCLERTHVYIQGASREVISGRIADCLRHDSIAAKTCTGNEVTAETSDCVSFSVRLWSSASDDSIIVEVQRQSGCGFVYQQVARRIFKAVKGESIGSCNSPKQNTFKLPSCLPPQSLDERVLCTEDGLKIAESLLRQDKLDTQLMALESLVMLSSPCQPSRLHAARCILSSDSNALLSVLKSLIQSHRLQQQLDQPDSHHHHPTDMELEHLEVLYRLALHALANCLSALAEAGELEQVVLKLTSESLMAALAQAVTKSETHPHEACQALRSLRLLCRSSKDFCNRIHSFFGGAGADHNNILATACTFGERSHAQLHEQALSMHMLLLQHQHDQ